MRGVGGLSQSNPVDDRSSYSAGASQVDTTVAAVTIPIDTSIRHSQQTKQQISGDGQNQSRQSYELQHDSDKIRKIPVTDSTSQDRVVDIEMSLDKESNARSDAETGAYVIRKKRRAEDTVISSSSISTIVSTTAGAVVASNSSGVDNKENGINLLDQPWAPAIDPTTKSFILPHFGLHADDDTSYQTLVIHCSIPSDPRRWSLNICPKDHKDNADILYHYNPRYVGKSKGVVMTDRQGTWGE